MFFVMNMMSISLLIFSLILSFNSNNWFQIWIALEINMMSFIPLMFYDNKTMISMMKYFFIQAISSSLFFFSIIFFIIFCNEIFFNIFIISIFTKLGMFPIFIWFPQVMIYLSWFSSFFLLTIQKLIPLFIMSKIFFSNFMMILIFMSIMISIMGLWNQVSLKKIMAYSSINHLCWMFSSILKFNYQWMVYFFVYSIIIASLIIMFSNFNLCSINQLSLMNKSFMLSMIINFWSLGGIPPLMGFFPKWLLISNSCNIILLIFLVLSSFLSLLIYSRIIFFSLMSFNKNFLSSLNMINLNLFFLIPMSLIFFF